MSIGLGDARVEVGEAARWLRDQYNPTTVRFYDYAGKDDLVAARSPPDTVTLEDLGRLICIAAGLRYERAHTLLDAEAEVPWPEAEIVPLATVDGEDAGRVSAAATVGQCAARRWWPGRRED